MAGKFANEKGQIIGQAAPLPKNLRGPIFLESVHSGYAVVCDSSVRSLQLWGTDKR